MTSPECPICLDKIAESLVAGLDSCSHRFCLECIRNWSVTANVCPVDRISFHHIVPGVDSSTGSLASGGSGKKGSGIVVADANAEDLYAEDIADDAEAALGAMLCERCMSGQFEDVLLLCDSCNLAYHTHCLEPPLPAVPEGNWYCDDCAKVLFRKRWAKKAKRKRRRSATKRQNNMQTPPPPTLLPPPQHTRSKRRRRGSSSLPE